MKGIILCAGKGTRLGSLCDHTPKALLPLGEECILDHILRQLRNYDFDHIAINLHTHAAKIIRHLQGLKSPRLAYFPEPNLLGTAGAIRNMSSFLPKSEDFLVHYGDIVTDQNLDKIIVEHKKNKSLATILVHKRKKSNSILFIDKDFRVREFHERPSTEKFATNDNFSHWVFSGIAVLSPEVINRIPTHTPFDLARDIFPSLAQEGKLSAVPLTGKRVAVDSPKRLWEAQNRFSSTNTYYKQNRVKNGTQ